MVWLSPDQIHLRVQCIYRGGKGPEFTIPCRKFRHEETDIITRKWGSEDDQIIPLPTFCAANLSLLRRQVPDMIEDFHRTAMSEAAGSMPEVMLETFKIAAARQVPTAPPLLLALCFSLTRTIGRTGSRTSSEGRVTNLGR